MTAGRWPPNERTRAAYGRAAGQFFAWCEGRALRLEAISSLHVAAYIRTHPGPALTVKQHWTAIRMLCDCRCGGRTNFG